ncbi:hypothetical protein KZX46_02170 (plasmid) [Polymorphobacter sp. PAMC 29334]|uniref:hypothetical protein n=1 Tax=Polymorphobacter sp. PAMC 29334 TaxID=2862331 RepID=UPI001C748D06|nr:hypothetical protein [Polymorphobacter sp. PAMC 29334]QYE32979.1 hypothetical protein KZX46_02170 [Polymorphobacter sp. PAMC 29334]
MGDDDKEKAKKLAAAGAAGYRAFPNDCSHSIWSMLRSLGQDEPYRTANTLMTHLQSKDSGWHQVTVQQAGELANHGVVVVGGLASQSGSGHVVMVMPGPPLPSSSEGSFPRSASGAASSWPGAHSSGEKTVRDPWSRPDWARVTFWTRD